MSQDRRIPLVVGVVVGFALVVLVVVTIGLAARGSGTHGSVSQAPVQATSTRVSGTVELPAALPNLKTLVQKGATSGSASAGSFYGHQGQVWISFSCLGVGTATVSYQPVGSVDIPCSDAGVNATKNQVYFPNDHQIDLHVSAPAGVEWAVLVQE